MTGVAEAVAVQQAGTGQQAAPARSITDLPGPPRLPVLGNAHQLRPETAHSTVEQWCERYGPIFRFDLGPRRIVAISDVGEINRVLRDRPDGFRRWREIKAVFDEIGSSGVFSEEGDGWRRQRRLSVTALNSNHLHRYFHVIQTATARLHRRLQGATASGQALDIVEELTSLTVDVTSALAFGHDLNTLERRDNALQSHIQRTFQMLARRILALVPYWRWMRLPADRALDRSLSELHSAVTVFIAEARERMAARPELLQAPENLLEGLLAAQHADSSFTDEEIIGNVLTLLLAGEDTTAHTMAWTLWFLAKNPDIQDRWAHEAREVLGEHPYVLDHQAVERLVYGEAVLRESMRLKPVAVVVLVEALADTTIADTHIPAGTRLWLATRHAGMQTVPRASEFDPERWLGDGDAGAPDQKSFLAFGAGPRFCPGRNLAFLEAKSALAMLARNFEIELDETDGPVTEQLSFTMIPRGLRLRLHERAPADAIGVAAAVNDALRSSTWRAPLWMT
jgi:cytochrome P450